MMKVIVINIGITNDYAAACSVGDVQFQFQQFDERHPPPKKK
jgi:hypothetical protein